SSFLSFFLLTRPSPSSTLFPYTTLFRSLDVNYTGCVVSVHWLKTSLRNESNILWNTHTYVTRAGVYEYLKPRVNMHNVSVSVPQDRKSTRLNSSHVAISYAVFCLKKKKK